VSNLFNVRRFLRPDQPQPVYTGALALWEAFLYPPIGDAERNSVRPPARATLDVRGQEWAPEPAWIQPVVDGIVRTWVGVFEAERQTFRVTARPALDVRGQDWSPQPAWIFTNLPAAVTQAQLWPAILEGVGLSYRSDARAVFDVRTDQYPPNAWIFTATDAAVARNAPVWAAQAGTFRAGERPRLDVRRPEWAPEFGWVQKAADAVIAKWAPVFAAELGYRSATRPGLDVRHGTAFPASVWTMTIPVVTTTLLRRAMFWRVGSRSIGKQ
jgi:hypothetical protein